MYEITPQEIEQPKKFYNVTSLEEIIAAQSPSHRSPSK